MNTNLIIFGIIVFIIENIVTVISIFESEYRAAKRSIILSILLATPFIVLGSINFPYRNLLGYGIIILSGVSFIYIFIPRPHDNKNPYKKPNSRIDERDTMFSRDHLVKETDYYHNYYAKNPDKKTIDDKIRNNPGLLSESSKYYKKHWFSAAQTNFDLVKKLRYQVNGEISNKKIKSSAQSNTNYLKSWLKELGVIATGVTTLKDYHIYSHGGRDQRYGKKFEKNYQYAIAFTVPMDFGLVKSAPKAPMVFESSRRYLQSAQIAVLIAEYIRSRGYPARAHIDGNYQVVCPLVARDAGLGEIGRMGILITPQHGPRARIAVVTTDLPLIEDKPRYSQAVVDFCENCKKCARVCPSNAIPYDNRKNIDGVERWQINQEACFQYWTKIGTDCGRCMQVCPYSHPDNFFHSLIRKGIENSSLFRKFAIVMDDFFYGKIPQSRKIPDWSK